MSGKNLRICHLTTLFVLLLGGTSYGAPPLTTIQDTLYKADGTPFEGVLTINWKSFEASDASSIPTNNLSVRVVKGILNLKLVPTTTAPSPAYYSVRYAAEGTAQTTEYWSVPPSVTRLRVTDVRVVWPPASGSASQAGNVQLADVEGLAEELSIRPTKGLSYLASRAAIIGPTGELESAAGDPTDCVRVDGSAGPCGFPMPSFVDGETPTGTVDGVNLSFTLSGTPEPAGSLQVFRNGLLQKLGTDYTLNGKTVIFVPASVPQAGDLLQTYYRLAPALIGSLGIVDQETPNGEVNGKNGTFALARAPRPATSLLVYKNGRLQQMGRHYTLKGKTIRFAPSETPSNGDDVWATYRIEGN
ncbi:MAG: hypothetical protein KIT09_24805 [Bryobacteraceae bacterium]|nr:hypothetical protein [Bryobacteraceae bacterium]